MVKFLSKAVFFISGLIIGHSLVDHAVVSIMISYLTDNWEKPNLKKAVIIKSVQEGLTSVLVIPLAHIADTFRIGRFNTILISTLAYVGGLTLLWIRNPYDDVRIYMVAGILLAVGQAVRQPPLKAFLADQMEDEDDKDNDRVEERARIIWRVLHFVGALIAFLALGNSQWNVKFMVSTMVIGFGVLSFLCGFKYYRPQNPTPSPLPNLLLVFKVAMMKLHLPYSNEPTAYFQNFNKDQLPLLPNIFFSRWLDKAALVVPSHNAEEEAARRNICTVAQVKDVKLVLRMIPMWVTFLVYGLVLVTGSTYFFEQSSNLDFSLGKLTVPIVSLYVIQTLSRTASASVSELIISTWFSEKRLRAEKVRIGIGMMCSFLSLIMARHVESKRLWKVQNSDFIDEENEIINMSVFCLAPQFCLLGMMEGLAEEGLEEFLDSQVAESMKRYGPPFNEFVFGIGKFSSIFWILIFNYWFGDSMNDSHMENYYGILAVLSVTGSLPPPASPVPTPSLPCSRPCVVPLKRNPSAPAITPSAPAPAFTLSAPAPAYTLSAPAPAFTFSAPAPIPVQHLGAPTPFATGHFGPTATSTPPLTIANTTQVPIYTCMVPLPWWSPFTYFNNVTL